MHILEGHDGEVCSASFSHVGDAVVTSSADASANIWDVPSGTIRHWLVEHDNTVWVLVTIPMPTMFSRPLEMGLPSCGTLKQEHARRLMKAMFVLYELLDSLLAGSRC